MSENGGQLLGRFLQKKEVPFLFTLCGGHISPLLVEAKRRGIRVVDVRDEATAVFAADATARLTGRPGVAAVTAGPGLTNALTAVQNAFLAQSPLILIGGAAPTVLRGRGALQDIDQQTLLRPLVKKVFPVNRNCDLLPAMEGAWEASRAGLPGPVFVECPIDLLYDPKLVRKWYAVETGGSKNIQSRLQQFYLKHHVGRMLACDTENDPIEPPVTMEGEQVNLSLDKSMEALAGSERPVMIVGSPALQEAVLAPRTADAVASLGIPVFLSGMARGLLGRNHPLHMRYQRRAALKEADLVVLAGVPADFRLDYGRSIGPGAQIIGINRDKTALRLNRRPDIGLVADPGAFLRRLAEKFTPPTDRWSDWFSKLHDYNNQGYENILSQSALDTPPINPLHLLMEVEATLPENSLIVGDGGDFVASASYILNPRRPLSWLDPGVFGTLGVGAGFAIGAALCRPGAEIWVVYGDGAFGYSLAEIDTLVRHRLPIIALVGNDASWAQIARDQVEILKDDVGTVLRRSDYHIAAQGLGAEGLALTRTADIGPVLAEAHRLSSTGRTVVINAHIGRHDFRKGSISM